MNDVIKTLTNHRSYRAYVENKPLDPKQLEAIVASTQAAPSWANGQQMSIIAVQDPERRHKVAELCNHQEHIVQASAFLVFCADLYRAKVAVEREGQPFVIGNHIESILISTVDVGLAMGNAIAAAESLGLGIVPIGAIRRKPQDVIELLQLPEYVFPISGLCIGYPAEVKEKNYRLPRDTVFFEETYDISKMDSRGFHDFTQTPIRNTTWGKRMTWYYSEPKYLQTADALKQQGFLCGDLRGEG